MRLMLAGGAPLSKEVHDFMRVCLGSTLIQGYGLTEVTACATLMSMDDLGTELVGIPNQVRIQFIFKGYTRVNFEWYGVTMVKDSYMYGRNITLITAIYETIRNI